ncbi:hypothetical protein Pelo_9869 [Pelomyxa schiedti]|nr:hypothetical protein Pelo_9869 [Pelomyxa schiedti]
MPAAQLHSTGPFPHSHSAQPATVGGGLAMTACHHDFFFLFPHAACVEMGLLFPAPCDLNCRCSSNLPASERKV